MVINTKNADEKRENVKEIENKILDLEDRIKEMDKKEKKMLRRHQRLSMNCLSPDIMFERLRDSSDEKNKSMVESINEKLIKLKNIVKKCAER